MTGPFITPPLSSPGWVDGYLWVTTLIGLGGAVEFYSCATCFGAVIDAPGGTAGRQGHTRYHQQQQEGPDA